jgi:hypothetical protein
LSPNDDAADDDDDDDDDDDVGGGGGVVDDRECSTLLLTSLFSWDSIVELEAVEDAAAAADDDDDDEVDKLTFWGGVNFFNDNERPDLIDEVEAGTSNGDLKGFLMLAFGFKIDDVDEDDDEDAPAGWNARGLIIPEVLVVDCIAPLFEVDFSMRGFVVNDGPPLNSWIEVVVEEEEEEEKEEEEYIDADVVEEGVNGFKFFREGRLLIGWTTAQAASSNLALLVLKLTSNLISS